MRRIMAVVLLGAWWGLAVGFGEARGGQDGPPVVELVASTGPRTPEEERSGFHLPPGFEVELVAAEPTINKPMNLSFDDRGRLWVTSSLEYPYPAKEGEAARDSVVVLEDFGPDGRARKATKFAEGLNIPIGVLALSATEALVHSIPNIYHMVDEDGDGRAERKEAFYEAVGFKDTHGMASAFTWGFDGWIYGCHGFANDSTIAGRDGKAIRLNSGNTYRLRADGSHIEQWTWGQVNPFGLAFSPLGDLFSCDCHSRPIMLLLRGGYYPSFGKPHDGLGFAPEIMTHDHGSTGIAGITYYAAEQFPASYRDTILIGNVVTSRINHDRLEWAGSTPRAVAQPDFLVSDDPWFRPVDIELGPDGALYVADFYNKIIGHYEVPLTHPGRDRERGRIWRIVYRGEEEHAEAKVHREDFRAATTGELAADLGASNIAVRVRAANLLCERGGDVEREAAKVAASDSSSVWRRVHGLHVLARLGVLEGERLVRAFDDPAAEVRVHAARVAAERADWSEGVREAALGALGDVDAFVRRAAADAVGQHASASQHLRALLGARESADPADAQLVHTLRMAIRDQLRPDEAWGYVAEQSWGEAEKQAIADVAPGVPSVASVRYLLGYLKGGAKPEPADMVRFVHHMTRQGEASTDRELVEFLAGYWPENPGFRADLFREAFHGCQERGAEFPGEGRAIALTLGEKLVSSTHPVELICGCNLAAELKLDELFEPIGRVVEDKARAEDQRARAMTALVAMNAEGAVGRIGVVLGDSAAAAGLRDRAASTLGQVPGGAAREALLGAIPTAPARLQSAIAIALAGSREGTFGLLERVAEGKASARVLQEQAVETKIRGLESEELNQRLTDLTASLPPAEEAIQELVRSRRAGLAGGGGQAERGKSVFTKHCAACHQLGGEGGRVGPQLDGVGVRGPERLLEDILDPNRNVDQAFRAVTLGLQNGQVLTGLPLREEGEIAVFADSKGEEFRVALSEVEERSDSALSLMPANLVEQVSEGDFYDLIEYLLTKREVAAAPASGREGSR